MSLRPDKHCRGSDGLACNGWRVPSATNGTVCVAGRSDQGLVYPDQVDVLFVTDQPGPRDSKAGTIMMDRMGRLWDTFAATHMKGYSWYLTSAARCFAGFTAAGKLASSKVATRRACFGHLANDVMNLRPKLIVPMGNEAISAVTGKPVKECKITKMKGVVFASIWDDGTGKPIPVVPIYKPGFMAKNTEVQIPIYKAQWDRVIDVLEGRGDDEPPGNWKWLDNRADIEAWYDWANKAKRKIDFKLAFDYETTGFVPQNRMFRMVGYAWDGENAIVHPLYEKWQRDLHWSFIKDVPTLACHQMLFEMQWMKAKFGDVPSGTVVDTKALAFLYDENMSMDLDNLTATFVPELAGFKRESEGEYDGDITELPDIVLARRCAFDCMVTFRLAEILSGLIGPKKVEHYLRWVERPMKVVAMCKARGWKLDLDLLAEMREREENRLARLRDTINRHVDVVAFRQAERRRLEVIATPEFNPNSTKQKTEFLASVGITPNSKREQINKNDEHHIKTAKDVLAPRQGEHPVIPMLLEYNDVKHAVTHFLRTIPEYQIDGYLYPGYNWGGKANINDAQGTVTARLSASKPNVMNPPDWLRYVFVSRFDDGVLVQADYKALELRLPAVVAPEPVLLEVFARGGDPHSETAERLGVPRPVAKVLNFAIQYGAGPTKLMESGLTYAQAKAIISAWYGLMSGIRGFMTQKHMEALNDQVVTGMFAQELHTPDALSEDDGERKHALNRAGNFPIQNAGGYLTLIAMAWIEERLREAGLEAIVIGQMHDSIMVDCPRHEREQVCAIIQECMVDRMHAAFEWLQNILEIDFTIGRTMSGNPLLGKD